MFDATVLIIEDEAHIRRAMKRAALLAARRVVEAEDAQEGLELGAAMGPDVVILDLGLPDDDGVNVCREIRRWSVAPIIVVTARDAQRDKIRLLDIGADDYITKPFDPDELGARLRVQLRRAMLRSLDVSEPVERYGHLTIDLPGRTVRRHDRHPDELVKLTRTEWELLATLTANAGRTMTHAALRDVVRTHSRREGWSEVRMHIVNLRRKIERDPITPELILTESGIGYRFERPE